MIAKPIPILALALLVLLLLRVHLAFDYLGFAADMGSHLMTRNWVLGEDPTGHKLAHFRPPLYGATLVPFTWAFGDLMGAKLLAILASVLLAIPVYAFARRWLTPWWAVIAAIAVINTPQLADILAGNQITLTALALAVWGWHWLIDVFEYPSNLGWEGNVRYHTRLWKPALPIFLLMGTNQTVMSLFILVAGAMWLFAQNKRMGLASLICAGAVAALWLPFYLVHLPGEAELFWRGEDLIYFTVRDDHLVAAIAFLVVWIIGRKAMADYLVAPALLLMILAFIGSADILLNNSLQRAVYLFPVLGGVAVISGLVDAWEGVKNRTRQIVRALLVAGLVLQLTLFDATFRAAANHLDILTDDNIAAIEWIGENTPKDSVIYAMPQGLGWWTGGLAPRAWYGSWYVDPVEFEDEHQAHLCALGWRDSCDPYQLRDSYNVSYLLVDAQKGAKEQRQDSLTVISPWLREVWQQGEVKVYEWK